MIPTPPYLEKGISGTVQYDIFSKLLSDRIIMLFDKIDDNEFDIVINRHESYNEKELFRILKPNGLFITQQVGAYNNKDLATFFDN